VTLRVDRLIAQDTGIRLSLAAVVFFAFCFTPAFSQDTGPTDHGAPKYDQKTEMQTRGVVDEVKLFTLGTRKDFVELIVKNGNEMIPIYVCPKPFQDEIGVTFNKGDQVAVTGSKVKQEAADVILARELVRGTDTLMFRDNKGNAVWDWRTGK
jgi:hypothetical protein